jgi:hypothetical protein
MLPDLFCVHLQVQERFFEYLVRSHGMEIVTSSSLFEVTHGSATLMAENQASVDEQRCLAELIDFLVERGAEVKRCD